MYVKKQQIEEVEMLFVEAIHEMDKAREKKKENEMFAWASVSCKLAETLGIILNTSEDEEAIRLYKKYDLFSKE